MEIFTKTANRGDGEALMTYARKSRKSGEPYEELLLNTHVTFIASNDLNQHLLLIGDAETGQYKIITDKELRGKSEFAAILRPYSFFGSSMDYEFMLNFWRINHKGKKLVYLKDILGRYKDDLADFWILDKDIIVTELKPSLKLDIRGTSSYENAFKILSVRHTGAIDFCIGDNWYWIDTRGVSSDLRLMAEVDGAEVKKESLLDVKKYLDLWANQYGNQIQNYAVLGWFIGLMFMDEVAEGRGSKFFPYFSLTGLTQAGKTSLIAHYLKFWGMEAKPTDWTQVSPFVEVKQLSQVANYPVWRDEFRENVGFSKTKETILRSLYNMSSLAKGTASQQLINYVAKTSLFLSGEDSLRDPATRRRAVCFGLSEDWKLKSDEWEVVSLQADEYFFHLFYITLAIGFDMKAFREVYSYAKSFLQTVNDKAEEGVCYAALGAVFGVELGKLLVDKASDYWRTEIRLRPGLVKKEDMWEQFWQAADTFFDRNDYYNNKTFYGETQKAKILELFWFKKSDEMVFVNIRSLVKAVYQQGGFEKETTINVQACESMILARFRTSLVKGSIGGLRRWGITFPVDSVPPDTTLDSILYNAKRAFTEFDEYSRGKLRDINEFDEPLKLNKPEDNGDLTQSNHGRI